MFDIFCYFLVVVVVVVVFIDVESTFAFYLLGFMCIPEPPKRVKLAMDVAKKKPKAQEKERRRCSILWHVFV